MQEIVPDYVKVRYEDRDIANIFSLTNLVKKKGVTYESHQYDAFSIHTNRGIIKLSRNKQGLYVFNPTYTTANSIFTTVEENMARFTSRQIENYELARKIYSNVGIPTGKNFNNMVSTNRISNCLISMADMINSGIIYGTSMESIKGNSTRIKPRPVINNDINTPIDIYKNNSNIELCIDVIYINGIAFLVYIDR